MTDRELLRQALDALVMTKMQISGPITIRAVYESITALSEALAAQHVTLTDEGKTEQEPVAFSVQCSDCGGDGLDAKDANYRCMQCCGFGFVERLLYTTPQPQRQPLTQAEVVEGFCKQPHDVQFVSVFDAGVRFAEEAHGITGEKK